ncbi:MAG: hypothetical protein GY782_08280 [Gammaproteobacteria bacterium]|nr:hypothetical protein [Gammaproteobacteria bacterium]
MAWETKKLGDLASIVNGGTPRTNNVDYWSSKDIPWLTPKDMGRCSSKEILKTQRYISLMGLASSSAKLIPKHSIILSTRAPIGYVLIAGKIMAFNQGCRGIIPGDKLLTNYLYYYLVFKKTLLNSLGQGATFKELSQGSLNSIEIYFPIELKEQKCIVAILDKTFEKIDKIRANTEKNLKNAKELFDSYLQQVFSQGGEDWETKKLGEVITLRYGKPLDAQHRNPHAEHPVYGANGIKTRSSKFLVSSPTIIVGRKGSAGEITLSEGKCWPLDVTYFVEWNESKIFLLLLFYQFLLLKLPRLASGVKPGINRNHVYSLSIQVPPLAEQKRIVAILDKLSDKHKQLIQHYTQHLTYLEELKQSILQQAFSGKLTTSQE